MRAKRAFAWTAGILAVLFLSALGYYYFVRDWNGRPFCHKQIMMSFIMWMDQQGMNADSHTNAFPNVNGLSQPSLATIREYMGTMGWTNDYNYVPGLREDDPGDLVLMYMNRPTRWTWHGPAPTRFTTKEWIVVPVDFKSSMRQPVGEGELSERIPQAEFEKRLNKTLDYLRTNQRPNWQSVVSEHRELLISLEKVRP